MIIAGPTAAGPQPVQKPTPGRRRLLYFLGGMAGAVFLMLGYLESSIVYPAPGPTDGDWNSQVPHEEVTFRSADGTLLHGWYLRHEKPQRSILFMHGNGEHVPYAAESVADLQRLLQANVFVFDYRGYGRSQGRPTEAGVLADGEAALDWLCQREQLRPDQIILYGRSLGGAVAVHLAAKLGASHLVLERTFTALTDVAASHFPWLPVRILMRNRYPSLERIRNYTGPLLISHGTRDEIVPIRLGRQLYDASPSIPKKFVAFEDCGHNDPNPAFYWSELSTFLQQ